MSLSFLGFGKPRSFGEFAWGSLVGPESARAYAELAEKQISEAVAVVESRAGVPLRLPICVSVEKAAVPWVETAAQPPRIVLPVSSLLRHEGLEGPNPDLVHELSHLCLFTTASPLLSEGWAVACAYALAPATYFPFAATLGARGWEELGVAADEAWSLADYFRNGSRIKDLTDFQNSSYSTQLAYARAGSFVRYLLERRGWGGLQMVFTMLSSAGASEQSAIEQVYGQPIANLESAWRAEVTPPERVRHFAANASLLGGMARTEWQLFTDTVIGGETQASAEVTVQGFAVVGKIGQKGSILFVTMNRYLKEDMTPLDVSRYGGISFSTRGDGKTYQLALGTARALEPGKEFMYMFSTRSDWVEHRAYFRHLQRFASEPLRWTGDDLVELRFRSFGYKDQPVAFEIRNVQFF